MPMSMPVTQLRREEAQASFAAWLVSPIKVLY
jgi:hypothetical protein